MFLDVLAVIFAFPVAFESLILLLAFLFYSEKGQKRLKNISHLEGKSFWEYFVVLNKDFTTEIITTVGDLLFVMVFVVVVTGLVALYSPLFFVPPVVALFFIALAFCEQTLPKLMKVKLRSEEKEERNN